MVDEPTFFDWLSKEEHQSLNTSDAWELYLAVVKNKMNKELKEFIKEE